MTFVDIAVFAISLLSDVLVRCEEENDLSFLVLDRNDVQQTPEVASCEPERCVRWSCNIDVQFTIHYIALHYVTLRYTHVDYE